MAIATFVVAARLRVRAKTHSLYWDDWFMLAALILQLFCMCAISVAFHYGLGKHDYDFTSFDEMVTVLKWSWIQMIPGCCTSILARISAAILLINIFGVRRWFRMYLLILTPLQTIGAIVVILVNWLQVSPVEGLWNPTIAVRHLDSRVALYTAYVGQSLFTLADFTYVLFPTIIIWNLQMELSRRIGLILLMSLSILTVVASIMKTIMTQKISSETVEPQYTSTLSALFSNLEQLSVIVMGSLPPLRASFVNFEFKGFKSLGSSLASLFTGTRSRKSNTDASATFEKPPSSAQSLGPNRGSYKGDRLSESASEQ